MGWMMKEAFRKEKTETKRTHQGEYWKKNLEKAQKQNDEERLARATWKKHNSRKGAQDTTSRDGNNRKEEGGRGRKLEEGKRKR